MQLEWWHWAVAGLALIVAELALPAFVLVWFGLGALLVGLVVLVAPPLELTAQLGVWLVASVALTALWFKVFKRGHHNIRIGMSNADIVGEVGLLLHDIAPFTKGEVRFQKPILGSEVWPCIADESISNGERVKVVAIDGNLLKVGRS